MLLSPKRSSHSQVETGWVCSVRSAHNEETQETQECWRGLVSEPAGWLVSTVQLSGAPDSYFYNCIAEIYYNYFNIAKARRERTRSRGNASVRVPGRARVARRCGTWEEAKQQRARRAQARESTRWMPRR